LLGPALLVSVAALSSPAHAQDAGALFDEGLNDMKAGRFKIGCALIKKSLELDARPGVLFTLAECYSKGGKYASAMSYYDRFLTFYETLPPEQREQQAARAEISRTERTRLVASVAWLTVTLPANAPQGLVVTLDGEEFSPRLFGVATAVDPGPHVFTTRAPDGPLIEQRIDISPGERRAAVLDVRSATSPGEATPPNEEIPESPYTTPEGDAPEPKHTNPWVYVAGGIGAAGLITGAVSGAMLLHERNVIMTECSRDKVTPEGAYVCKSQEGKDAVDRAQGTLAPLTTVALTVGIVGTVTAIVLYVMDRPAATTEHAALPRLEVGPNGASLGFQSTW
jgi:hypothetical protein